MRFFIILLLCLGLCGCAGAQAGVSEHAATCMTASLRVTVYRLDAQGTVSGTEYLFPWERDLACAVTERFLLDNGLDLPADEALHVIQTGDALFAEVGGLFAAYAPETAEQLCKLLTDTLSQLPNAERIELLIGGKPKSEAEPGTPFQKQAVKDPPESES